MRTPEQTAAMVSAALGGDAAAIRALVATLSPVIHARVAGSMLRSGTAGRQRRDVRQGVEDFTQEVFVALFADGGKALRSWDPARGLSLENFVGLIAEHQVASILRSGRRNPWTEEAMLSEEIADVAGAGLDADNQVYSREVLAALEERLASELTPRGLLLFRLLIVEQCPVEAACQQSGMNLDAIYAWRSRLGKLVRNLAQELDREFVSKSSASSRSNKGGLIAP